MRILVVGASSGVGRLVAAQAIARGDAVVALSRSGSDVSGADNVVGDAAEASVIEAALRGVDAVVITVGGAKGEPDHRTRVTAAVLAAAQGRRRRVVVNSSLGVGDSAPLLGAPGRLLAATVLKAALADHATQEAALTASDARWTIVRPGGLTNGAASGRISTGEGRLLPRIARADVAAFILGCLDDDATIGRAVPLGTPV